MNQAFVLGAGLGTRLRPLTDQLPKPLVPVFHRPLITYAFDHLRQAGIKEFIVNTHHLPTRYEEAFPTRTYEDLPVTFRHEPVLLETAGGIANIADLLKDQSFLVYNGDILTDLPLASLLQRHEAEGNIVTLVLRSTGPGRHIEIDETSGRLTDIRNLLGTGGSGTHQFTGIYAVHQEFLKHLSPGKIESVIPIFLALIKAGAPIGGVVVDEGGWWDLGDRRQYMEAHWALLDADNAFPLHDSAKRHHWERVSPEAMIAPDAILTGDNVISAGAQVGAGASLESCILWPGASVAAGARLKNCIVRSGRVAEGEATDQDF